MSRAPSLDLEKARENPEDVCLLSEHDSVVDNLQLHRNHFPNILHWFRMNIYALEHLALGCLFAGFVILALDRRLPQSPLYQDMKSIESLSPAQIAAGPLHSVMLNNSLRVTNPYKGPPSGAIDKAWQDLWYVRPGTFTRDEVINVGQDPDKVARWTDEYGGGYIGTTNAHHNLHCLDYLRKASWGDTYKNTPWFLEADGRKHLDHCIDLLRSVLMCHADPGMKTFVWVENWAHPYPDNVALHECRDFAALDKFARSREMDHEAFLALDSIDRHGKDVYNWPDIL